MVTATATQTVTINAAFLQEIKDDNRHLRDVRKAIRALIANRILLRNHRSRLVTLLDEFLDQLAMHFALEEAYGYFDDAFDVAPHFSEAVEQLRSEHSELFGVLVDIAAETEMAVQHRAPERAMDQLVERLLDFDSALSDHERRETDLIVEALDRDIGGEG